MTGSDDYDRPSPEHVSLGFGSLSAAPGDHIVHFYYTADDRLELQLPFFSEGLSAGHKCVFLTAVEGQEDFERRLAAKGHDVESAKATGQLVVSGGLSTVDELRNMLHQAMSDVPSKFEFLRWCGDMTWTFEKIPTSDVLMEWESACNVVGPGGVVFLCQYDLNRFGGDVVIDALRTHPLAVVGKAIHQSPYYETPDAFLENIRERPSADLVAIG